MSTPDHYNVLHALVQESDLATSAPMIGPTRLERLEQLRAEVETIALKPVEGPRFVGTEARLLAELTVIAQRARNCGDPTVRFDALIGVLLAFVRVDLFECGMARLAARPATTEQTR